MYWDREEEQFSASGLKSRKRKTTNKKHKFNIPASSNGYRRLFVAQSHMSGPWVEEILPTTFRNRGGPLTTRREQTHQPDAGDQQRVSSGPAATHAHMEASQHGAHCQGALHSDVHHQTFHRRVDHWMGVPFKSTWGEKDTTIWATPAICQD